MSDAVLVAIVAAIPGTLSVLVSLRNKRDIRELHLAVNSRLTELLEQTAKASHAEGRAERRSDDPAGLPSWPKGPRL